MNAIGGQEITMPVIHPAEIWKQSGRWEGIPEMFKLQDRYGRDLCLGMTHEEVVAWLAAREIRSYRDLPQIWYHIQTKERDEARPRSGVLRTREFLMKDAYPLDPDVAALDRSYAAHERAYRQIFDRCGLSYWVVQSDTGMMGGLGSHEFMAPPAACGVEAARHVGCGAAPQLDLGPPGPAPHPFTSRAAAGLSTSPMVTPARSLGAGFAGLPAVTAGEACVECGKPLGVEKVIEIGNIFKLGTKYSAALGATYLDESGREQPIVMGSYGIGPARIAAAAIEQLADGDGIVWPWPIAPLHAYIVCVSVKDQAQRDAAEAIYDACWAHGLEAMLDDRDERPGVKFKDADLLGIPVRVTVGNSLVKEGVVEVRSRKTRQESRVPRDKVVDAVRAIQATLARS